MGKEQYRQEIKRLLSPGQAILLRQRIGAVMQTDAYGGADDSYTIRSVYFDTVTDGAFDEKEAGINEREKIRIRFYNYQDDVIKLERKEKRRNLIKKESMSISKETANAMLQGNYEPLLDYKKGLADYVYSLACGEGLHPVVVVDYVRKAYVYSVGNVRITFDSELQAGKTDIPIWERSDTFDVLQGNTILEIKFNEYLPDFIHEILSSVSAASMSLSKYTLSRQNLLYKQGDFLGGKR